MVIAMSDAASTPNPLRKIKGRKIPNDSPAVVPAIIQARFGGFHLQEI